MEKTQIIQDKEKANAECKEGLVIFKGNSVMVLNRGSAIQIRGALQIGPDIIKSTSTPYFGVNNYEVIGIGRNLTVPPSHTTWHTGPYQGGSVSLNARIKH